MLNKVFGISVHNDQKSYVLVSEIQRTHLLTAKFLLDVRPEPQLESDSTGSLAFGRYSKHLHSLHFMLKLTT